MPVASVLGGSPLLLSRAGRDGHVCMCIAAMTLAAIIATVGYARAADSLDDCPSFKANKDLMIDMQKAATEAAGKLKTIPEDDQIARHNQLCTGIRLQTYAFNFYAMTFKNCEKYEGAAEQLKLIGDAQVELSVQSMQNDCSLD